MTGNHRSHRTFDARIAELTALMESMARVVPQMMRGAETTGIGFDLTHHQFMLLCVLDSQGPTNMAVVRKMLGCAQSTTSEMIGRLAKLGYVEKHADPNDSRAVVVEATARGRRVVRARREHIGERHREILLALSPEDQDRFVEAFRTMVTLMQSALSTRAGDEDNA